MRRVRVESHVPLCGAATNQHHLCPVTYVADFADGLRVHGTGIIPTQTLGVGTVEHRKVQVGIYPPVQVGGVVGMDGEARGQLESMGRCHLGQTVPGRPWPFRIDVVSRNRRDTTEIVDTGIEQDPEIVGQVGRGLEVDLGRQKDAG